MTTVLQTASLIVAGAALAAGLLALVATRRPFVALPVLLDLLLAAGLLRLASAQTWTAILGAAAIVALRRLVTAALQRHRAVARQ